RVGGSFEETRVRVTRRSPAGLLAWVHLRPRKAGELRRNSRAGDAQVPSGAARVGTSPPKEGGELEEPARARRAGPRRAARVGTSPPKEGGELEEPARARRAGPRRA